MQKTQLHTFHIPVLGLGFSIDSPVKVARYGIHSVISLSDHFLIEKIREYYCNRYKEPYTPIGDWDEDANANRIRLYLNLVHQIVKRQMRALAKEIFSGSSQLDKYFRMLPENSPLRKRYFEMMKSDEGEQKKVMQDELRKAVKPGRIDVNIMTRLNRTNFTKRGMELPPEFSDAMAAMRGFAESELESMVVFSAGMNARLFTYMESFDDFYFGQKGIQKKQIAIKVSDFRSAKVQGKILAKKGLWVSEFRVESGLNCGGHAFPTEGLLLGPILDEFSKEREALRDELWEICMEALASKGKEAPATAPELRITVQGGIGTAEEQQFLLDHYGVDATGWGSPFLLVNEATSVDDETMDLLVKAGEEELYLSDISPLGVPFNTVKGRSMEKLKLSRISRGKPGSPCVKKILVSNTEFTKNPICTASRAYQKQKIESLKKAELEPEEFQKQVDAVTEKECLCEGLANPSLALHGIKTRQSSAPAVVCPGPNLAWFSGSYSLEEMAGHIYGREMLLNGNYRPHMFINELKMYVDYFLKINEELKINFSNKQEKYISSFKTNLEAGIAYYRGLIGHIHPESQEKRQKMEGELRKYEEKLEEKAHEDQAYEEVQI